VHVVPNPATFSVGDLVVSATSTDPLFNLNRDETTRMAPTVPGGGPRVEKLPRLAQHLIEQRCMFPQFPAPPAALGKPLPSDPSTFSVADAAVPLELSQMWSLGLPCSPDVLLVPSKLTPFVRGVGSTLAINPGHLCRGNVGGTYARITVNRPRRDARVYGAGESPWTLLGAAAQERCQAHLPVTPNSHRR